MKVVMYIPYASADCVNGFKCDRTFTRQEYAKMELDEYREHKGGVDMMMPQLGYNIAQNHFTKRKINVKSQDYYYYDCQCTIMNMDNTEVTLSQLDSLYRSRDKFILFVYLNREDVKKNADMETDLNMWLRSSLKIKNCAELTDEEMLVHLPKKDFKIKIPEDKSNAVLKDCKLMDTLGSNTAFAILVDRIIFTKN